MPAVHSGSFDAETVEEPVGCFLVRLSVSKPSPIEAADDFLRPVLRVLFVVDDDQL